MSFIELFIVVIAGILFIKPEQLPDIIRSVRQLYQSLTSFLRQQEKQITQSSQLEWLNKKMSQNKSKKKD